MMRYLSSYVLDFFRERVTPEDFAGERVRGVRLVGEAELLTSVAERMFPGAKIGGGPAEAVVIGMTGGEVGERLRALLGRARHKLLVPSPDYVYRFGMRRGPRAMLWAILDRFVLAPLALLWLGALAVARYATGPVVTEDGR